LEFGVHFTVECVVFIRVDLAQIGRIWMQNDGNSGLTRSLRN
jgi:hypothetical protein